MTIAETAAEIPTASWYVAATDRFMSGWGHAEGRSNRHVIPCPSYAVADLVETEAHRRSEWQRVTAGTTKPRNRGGVIYTYGPWEPLAERALGAMHRGSRDEWLRQHPDAAAALAKACG